MIKETIAAIATGMSNSGIGIIRMSGKECFDILDKIFEPAKKENIEPEKRLELMNNSVEYFENNEEFDLEKFTEKVFDNQEESDKFKVYIDSYDVDNKFSISSNAVTKIKKTIKKCIKLDDNVEIKFSDTVDDIDNLIEKGYDREKKRKYYKIYYNDED